MRTLLIGVGACLTVGTFVVAERLTTSTANAVAVEQQAATQAALDAQLKTSNDSFAAEIASLKDLGNAATAQVSTLTDDIAALTTERDELAGLLAAAEQETASNTQRVEEVDGMNPELAQKVDLYRTALATKDVRLETLRARVDDLMAQPEVASVAGSDDSQLAEDLAALSETLKTRDETIASLQDAIATANAAQVEAAAGDEVDAPNAALIEELEAAQAQVDALTAAAAEQETAAEVRISELTEALDARDAAIAALEAELSETTVAAETADAPQDEQVAQTEALDAQIAELTQIVASQTDTIANLRMGFGEEPVSAMEMAEACIARANKIFELSQINFGTGTASISQDSVATLDNLRDLAIGCDSEDMFIEIGGHTDSFGAEADNQALSEARATTVKDFLIGRGIAEESMVAVGFGEAQPVATNDTAAGRAENRRITFTWKMRDDETSSMAETSSVDG